jgi:hypothetical protein
MIKFSLLLVQSLPKRSHSIWKRYKRIELPSNNLKIKERVSKQ